MPETLKQALKTPTESPNDASLPIAVIGAGPMGLAAAYELLLQGKQVTLLEAGPRLGGMTTSFEFAGIQIERFFHFLCRTDYDYFKILEELNLSHTLKWRDTRMGYFYQGKMSEWGEPIALLKFPSLSLLDKIRYGALVMYCKQIKNWDALDKVPAHEWLQKWLGQNAYDVLWDKLLSLKFYQHADNISAAWIGARIKRVGNSRRSLFHESLGYLEGGSETLVHALEKRITDMGGTIHINTPVEEIVSDGNQVSHIKTKDGAIPVSGAISTVPFPYVSNMIPALPLAEKQQLESIQNIGVATVIMKLKRSLTPYFWTNTTDDNIEIPGFIEYSNLNPMDGAHILYVPYYMPQTHEKYQWSDDQFKAETIKHFSLINPDFREQDIEALTVSRYHYAQTVCEPGHSQKIPPLQSQLKGLFLADTSSYYPEDRCINDSVRVGRELARLATQ